MWQREGVTHYSDATHSVFYYDYLFYFFLSINHNSSSFLYRLFNVLMSIKNLQLTSLSIVAYYLLVISLLPPKIEGHEVPFLQGSCSFCVGVWHSSQQFCGTPFHNFVESLSVFLQNTYQYFCRTTFSVFAENFSPDLQKTQACFQNTFSCFCKPISVDLQNTSPYFFEIISQYFCITPPNICRN